jgi:hypothetical protein
MPLESVHRTPVIRAAAAAALAALARDLDVDVPRLMTMLLPFAAEYARPPAARRAFCLWLP